MKEENPHFEEDLPEDRSAGWRQTEEGRRTEGEKEGGKEGRKVQGGPLDWFPLHFALVRLKRTEEN